MSHLQTDSARVVFLIVLCCLTVAQIAIRICFIKLYEIKELNILLNIAPEEIKCFHSKVHNRQCIITFLVLKFA